MTLVRRIARPLLAAVFVEAGVEAARRPGPGVDITAPIVHRIAGPLGLPDDPELLLRANGAAMAGAGVLLGLGRLPRLASTVLAVTLVPSTLVQHPFWTASDADEKSRQRGLFLKNVGLLGGVLLAAVDTEGNPGVAWRAQNAASGAKRAARRARKDAKRAGRAAKNEARLNARLASERVEHRVEQAIHR